MEFEWKTRMRVFKTNQTYLLEVLLLIAKMMITVLGRNIKQVHSIFDESQTPTKDVFNIKKTPVILQLPRLIKDTTYSLITVYFV